MAGGTFINQDKILAGAYINTKARKEVNTTYGQRGIATFPLILSWGKENTVMTLTPSNCREVLGLDANDVLALREGFKGCNTIKIFRLNGGVAAKKVHGTITFVAACTGVKGNSIQVIIQSNIVEPSKWDITTLFEGVQVNKQTIGVVSDFKPNGYITLEGTGAITATAGITLEGGTDATATNADYTRYLAAIETHTFDCMAISTTDTTLKATVKNFISRLRETDGRKVQCVMPNYPTADYEGIISVNNGVQLVDRTLTAAECVYFKAAVTAGADDITSNTHREYPGAIDAVPRYTTTDTIEIVKNGEIVFSLIEGVVMIEKDINTLKTFTEAKSKDLSKNKVLRVYDSISNYIKSSWDLKYAGKIPSNDMGRDLFKADLITDAEKRQSRQAIQNFVAEDITVAAGVDKESTFVRYGAEAVDAMEKIYVEMEVR